MARRTSTAGVTLALAACLGLAACSSSGGSGGSGGGGSAATALVIEDNTSATAYTNNFNPFDSGDFVLSENTAAFVYEPLMQINSLSPSSPAIPWLAKSFTWSDSGKTLTIALNPSVKWSDGTALTSADVAFTYQMVTQNQAMNLQGVPTASSITTPDANTVVLNFTTPQQANYVGIANQLIVQKKQWSTITSPATYVLTGGTAIGTGPYTLDTFSGQDVKYKSNANYWGGAPKVKELSVPLYTSNNAAALALESGQIDLAGNDISSVQSAFVGKDPTHNHLYESSAPYFPASNTVSLMLNNHSSQAPALGDADVRLAISAALNRQSMASQCETSYELPASSAGGLTLPTDQSQLNSATSGDISPTPDQSTVAQHMQAAGYTMTGNKWTKNGQQVSFTIIDPNSFSDYWCDAQEMVTQLNTAGFNVTANGAFDYNSWTSAITSGNFTAALHWGQGSTPFQRDQFIMDSTQSAAEGSTAGEDYDRFDNAQAQAAISAYESASSSADQQTAMNTIQQVFASQMPAVPVLYGAAWYEYNDTHFTGWPTSQNAYINPSPQYQSYEYLVLHLSPVS